MFYVQFELAGRKSLYLSMQLGVVMYFMHSHFTMTNTLISAILLWLQ